MHVCIQVYCGILLCTVESGINLSSKNLLTLSDPYVVARVGNAPQEAATRVVHGSLNPEWQEQLTMNISSPQLGDKLFVKCYNADAKRGADRNIASNREKDALIGDGFGAPYYEHIGVDLSMLRPGEAHQTVVKLLDMSALGGDDRAKKRAHTGDLRLTLLYSPLDH